ncbi:alpha/beta fold hydrolase [Bacillus pseudomycoides]|uniref:alpha/beta fold hydrolase n=1 Tax=Bacillus pseudomycoides TaxID=64104 RepID=UPI00211D9F16|nr:alpha/beta hydrolase [Bacillus pseudomycoides]
MIMKQLAETVDTAYLEFGATSEVPIVFCQRFQGTMDDWDPAVVNDLAQERRIILFDNVGVGLSSGESPIAVPAITIHPARKLSLPLKRSC